MGMPDYFSGGNSGSVAISNIETTGFVIADAIRLAPNERKIDVHCVIKNKRKNLLVKAVLGSMLLFGVAETHTQTAPDVTAGVVDLGPTGTWEVFSLVRHRERLYMINGAQGKVASARYFDLTSNSSAADGSIPLEAPWGGKISNGSICLPRRPVLANSVITSPCLEAAFLQAAVGRKLEKAGEQSILILSAAMGRW